MVFLALVMSAFLGVASLGVEAGMWFYNKRDLQTQADAAAFSGAFAVASGHGGQMSQYATNEAIRNGFVNAAPATITVQSPPTSGPHAGNPQAVEAILSIRPPLMMAALFRTEMSIVARSVARVEIAGEACILALHPTANRAVRTQGSTTVNVENCIVAANSSDQSAIEIGGNGSLTADTLWTVGSYSFGGSATLNVSREPVTNAWPLVDPYADLTIPASLPCDYNNKHYQNESVTITAGVYCNGLDIGANANVTFQPGIYYINRGDFNVNANSIVRCNCSGTQGVTIVLTSTTTVNQIGRVVINGGADIILKAPTTGAYAGVSFFQDRRAPASTDNKFNGGSNMRLTGAVYFPNQNVEWEGNNGTSSAQCTQIIAQMITFIGNSRVTDDGCAAAGARPITVAAARFSS